MNKTNRWLVWVLVMFASSAALGDAFNPVIGGSGGGDSMIYDHWSPLTVTENITNLGGGTYQYSYSFVNTDSSPLWNFQLHTPFSTVGYTNFTGHPTWGGPNWVSFDHVWPEYDARNIRATDLGMTAAWTMPWVDSATAIQVGEAASGFSFLANTYDASSKYFSYETIASGYTQTNGTGKVAAVGMTGGAPPPPPLGPLVNPGFETGDLTGWTTNVTEGGAITVVAARTGQGRTWTAAEGQYFALLKTDGPGSVEQLTQSFAANAGDVLSFSYFFDGEDYLPFDDYARGVLRNLDTGLEHELFYQSIALLGNYGNTPWTPVDYLLTVSGNYEIRFEISNSLDSSLDSYLGVDFVHVVPEPGTLLLLALGGLGLAGRRMRSGRRKG